MYVSFVLASSDFEMANAILATLKNIRLVACLLACLILAVAASPTPPSVLLWATCRRGDTPKFEGR